MTKSDNTLVNLNLKSNLSNPLREKHYKDRRKMYFLRLSLTYLSPTVILILFLIFQFINLSNKSRTKHILSVAESQARILDIFMKERVSNLLNLIDNPNLNIPPTNKELQSFLMKRKMDSESFIDLGFFDTTGIQKSYAGPLQYLEKKNYSGENWYKDLITNEKRFIITDIYLGKRKKPHFTIGVKRYLLQNNYIIIKSSLDPKKIYETITSFEKSQDVNISIVNRYGYNQLVKQKYGTMLKKAPFNPNFEKAKGIGKAKLNNLDLTFAYSWLAGTNWAVIVHENPEDFSAARNQELFEILIPSFFILGILILILIVRSKSMVIAEYEKDIVKGQLEQASKLATVGELAAGIAHEIGNPLNIIANEVGIMQDYANPRFNFNKSISELQPNFDKIMKAVFRCKDVNKKLLSFVRVSDSDLKESNLHELIEDFICGFFEHEMSLRNISLLRNYNENLPKIKIDENQFRQVVINLLNNAADAISKSGKIIIKTDFDDKFIYLTITDTGCGITDEQINKIFMPFFTTKPVGKGTGLGLSVSYNIIKNMGGDITVESIPGKGTSFTVVLPFFLN